MLYDDDQDKVQLNICLSRNYRGMLRKIAAKRLVAEPDRLESAASVGAEIIKGYLDELEINTQKKE
jgi:hypothetical protein